MGSNRYVQNVTMERVLIHLAVPSIPPRQPVMPVLCDFDITQRSLNFPHPFADRPRLVHGLREIDIGNNANIRVSSTLHNIKRHSADCDIITWGDTTLFSAVADVIALTPADSDILIGEHMRSLRKNPNYPASVRIDFERPFSIPPIVVVFFNCIELDKSCTRRLKTTATDIDTNGFTLHIDTWMDTILYAARVGWIAYPGRNEGGIYCASVNTGDIMPMERRLRIRESGGVSFGAPMRSAPSVFIALNYLDIDCSEASLRINAYVDNVSTTQLTWHIDSGDDTVVHSAGVALVAFA